MKNLSPAALVTSLVLSLSLSTVVVAQFNPTNPPPSPDSGQAPNQPPGAPNELPSRPNQRPGGASQAPQLFQGESRNLSFTDALKEALNKARQSTGGNSNSTINFRVVDTQGVAGSQRENLLRVTIQILPTASSRYDGDRSIPSDDSSGRQSLPNGNPQRPPVAPGSQNAPNR